MLTIITLRGLRRKSDAGLGLEYDRLASETLVQFERLKAL